MVVSNFYEKRMKEKGWIYCLIEIIHKYGRHVPLMSYHLKTFFTARKLDVLIHTIEKTQNLGKNDSCC